MIQSKSALVLVLGLASTYASAQATSAPTSGVGESKVKVEDAAGRKNKVDGDIDETITNAKLRAESGSKSKFSMSTGLSYTGGSVDRAFGRMRPNLNGIPGNQTATSANIGVDARYRMTKNDSITLGTSIGMMTPFQGDVDNNPQKNQVNFFDPSLGYNRAGKLGQIQVVGSVLGYAGTSKESIRVDRWGRAVAKATALYAFQNKLSVGLGLTTYRDFFTNHPGAPQHRPRAAARAHDKVDTRVEQYFQIAPLAEYALSDRFQLRTVFGYMNWAHLYGDDQNMRFIKLKPYQSVGVGMAVTRDIYLYPNVQFVPDNIRSDFTNVALSATINTF